MCVLSDKGIAHLCKAYAPSMTDFCPGSFCRMDWNEVSPRTESPYAEEGDGLLVIKKTDVYLDGLHGQTSQALCSAGQRGDAFDQI